MHIGQSSRLYFQGADNYIYEATYNGTSGWASDYAQIVKAAPRTGLAAINFNPESNIQIRLYYLNEQNRLSESAYNI